MQVVLPLSTCHSFALAHRTTVSLPPAAVSSNTMQRGSCLLWCDCHGRSLQCAASADLASAACAFPAASSGFLLSAESSAELPVGGAAAELACSCRSNHAAWMKYMPPSCSAVTRVRPAGVQLGLRHRSINRQGQRCIFNILSVVHTLSADTCLFFVKVY